MAEDRFCAYCAAEVAAGERLCMGCGLTHARAKRRAAEDDRVKTPGPFGEKSVWGGCAVIAIAVLWFVGGLQRGTIWFYPPFMALAGIGMIFSGVEKAKQRDTMRARRRALDRGEPPRTERRRRR